MTAAPLAQLRAMQDELRFIADLTTKSVTLPSAKLRRWSGELDAVLAAIGEPPTSPEQAIYVRCVEPWHIWPDDRDTRCQCGQSTRRLVGDAPPPPQERTK